MCGGTEIWLVHYAVPILLVVLASGLKWEHFVTLAYGVASLKWWGRR